MVPVRPLDVLYLDTILMYFQHLDFAALFDMPHLMSTVNHLPAIIVLVNNVDCARPMVHRRFSQAKIV